MKKEDLFESIGGIDDRYISAAEEYDKVIEMPRRRSNWVKWAATAACICLVLGFGGSKLLSKPQAGEGGNPIQGNSNVMQPQPVGNNADVPQPAGNNTDRPQTADEHEKDAAEQTQKAETEQRAEPRTDYENEQPAPDNTIPARQGYVDGVCKASDFYPISDWNGKTVWSALAKALDEAPDKVFDILARPYIDYDFVYNGKTLAQYYSDMCDERNLSEKLLQLLKTGDSLKYGTQLYEGGAPSGEKWAKEWYEEVIAFFGQEMLDKYIVNGEFLAAQVKDDAAAALEQKDATKAYNTAFAAYYQHLKETLQTFYPADVKAESGLVLHMTAEEFKNFNPDKVEAWTFSFDTPVPETPQDTGGPIAD